LEGLSSSSALAVFPDAQGFLVSTDTEIVAATPQNQVRIWETLSPSDRINAMTILPDGRILASGKKEMLRCFCGVAPQYYLNEGCHALQRGQYEEAVRHYELSARYGYPKGQVNLGNLYAEGIGVARNIQEARRFYELAAEEKNDPLAQNNLGFLYLTEETLLDEEMAYTYLERATYNGCAAAQCHLGFFY
jgi:TPR repeat protein